MRGDKPDGAGFFLFFSLFSLLRLVTTNPRIPPEHIMLPLGPIAFLVLAVAAGAVCLWLIKERKNRLRKLSIMRRRGNVMRIEEVEVLN